MKSKVKLKALKQATVLGMWSRAVKVRDGFRCMYCGSRNNLESHHIFKVQHSATKYDLDNGITLCKACHDRIDKSYEMGQWLKHYIGLDKYDALDRKHFEIKQWSKHPAELKEKYESLKEFIKERI